MSFSSQSGSCRIQTVTVHLHRRACELPEYSPDVKQSTCCFFGKTMTSSGLGLCSRSQSWSSNTRCVLNLHPACLSGRSCVAASVKGESGSACFFGLFCSFLPQFYFCVGRRFIVIGLLHPFPSSVSCSSAANGSGYNKSVLSPSFLPGGNRTVAYCCITNSGVVLMTPRRSAH